MERIQKERLFDIDWLRVIAVFLLIPFHAALIFVQNPNLIMYIKDGADSPVLTTVASVIHQFHLPLLFTFSGMVSYLTLG